MPETSFRLEGLDKLTAQLQRLINETGPAVARALYQEAEIEMAEAKRRTPVDTGALRSSGHVVGPTWDGRDVTVQLVFGGPAAPYALYVHENLEAWHKVGQSKFLESVLHESVPHLAQRIAARASNEIVGIT